MSFGSPLISKQNLAGLTEGEARIEIMTDEFRKLHIELEKARPQLADFKDVWSRETIRRANQEVMDFKDSPEYRNDNDEIGQVGEDVVQLLCSVENVIPGVDQFFSTARFDDYLRGVDLILKFVPDAFEDMDKKAVYLGIDVKTTLDVGKIEDKIKKIEDRLSHPEEANIEFFRDNSEMVDSQTKAKYANVLPPRKTKANEYFHPAPAVAEQNETEEKPLAGRLSVPRLVLQLDPKLCVAMQKILVKEPEKRTPQEKERIAYTKFMLEVNLINQLFALDLYFDLQKMSTPNHKALQRQYQDAITAVLEGLNLKELLQQLDQIVSTFTAMKYPPQNVLRDLQQKKEYILEYIETRNLEI